MDRSEAVARPYAEAVFELAREAGSLAAWSALLADAAAAVQTPSFSRLIGAPGVDREALAAAIADACRADAAAAGAFADGAAPNFLRLLAENSRLAALPAIAAAFERRRADIENTIDVVLTSATPVDEDQQARMVQALGRRFGREIRLRFVLDESLIGGARLQAEDLVIDGSVRTRLAKLASALVH